MRLPLGVLFSIAYATTPWALGWVGGAVSKHCCAFVCVCVFLYVCIARYGGQVCRRGRSPRRRVVHCAFSLLLSVYPGWTDLRAPWALIHASQVCVAELLLLFVLYKRDIRSDDERPASSKAPWQLLR